MEYIISEALYATLPVEERAYLWKTGVFEGRNDDLPLGPAHLAWSFNHDGEAKPGMVEGRDRRMDLRTRQERQARAPWVDDARPQGGVLAIAGAYPKQSAIAGVEDNGDRAPNPVPTVGMREPGVTGTSGGRRGSRAATRSRYTRRWRPPARDGRRAASGAPDAHACALRPVRRAWHPGC